MSDGIHSRKRVYTRLSGTNFPVPRHYTGMFSVCQQIEPSCFLAILDNVLEM